MASKEAGAGRAQGAHAQKTGRRAVEQLVDSPADRPGLPVGGDVMAAMQQTFHMLVSEPRAQARACLARQRADCARAHH